MQCTLHAFPRLLARMLFHPSPSTAKKVQPAESMPVCASRLEALHSYS